jgi:hypothetical protein
MPDGDDSDLTLADICPAMFAPAALMSQDDNEDVSSSLQDFLPKSTVRSEPVRDDSEDLDQGSTMGELFPQSTVRCEAVPVRDDILLLPRILPASMTKPHNEWQYHGQDGRHGQIQGVMLLIDLLRISSDLRNAASTGSIGFGLDSDRHDAAEPTGKSKRLDLVLGVPGDWGSSRNQSKTPPKTLGYYIDEYLVLSPEEEASISLLRAIPERHIREAYLVVECKATMTAHTKALPRVTEELGSARSRVCGKTVLLGFLLVNVADQFVSPDSENLLKTPDARSFSSNHDPGQVTQFLKAMVRPERFDALSVLAVNCRNDGSRVEAVQHLPEDDPRNYGLSVREVARLIEERFFRSSV